MEALLEFIQQNVQYAPYIVFGALLLAGLNIPVSEDAMLFVCGVLAAKYPDMLISLFVAVYFGAYFSDLICFGLGKFLKDRIWNVKLFARFVSRDKINQVTSFYERYGVRTLIFGRFVPFGVRNALFLSAGIGDMATRYFALADLLAVTISVSIYFWLYYTFGEAVLNAIAQANVVIFAIFIGVVGIVLMRKKRASKAS